MQQTGVLLQASQDGENEEARDENTKPNPVQVQSVLGDGVADEVK